MPAVIDSLGVDTLHTSDLVDCRVDRVWGLFGVLGFEVWGWKSGGCVLDE